MANAGLEHLTVSRADVYNGPARQEAAGQVGPVLGLFTVAAVPGGAWEEGKHVGESV